MSSPNSHQLSDSDHKRIERLSDEGNDLYEIGELQKALDKYRAALEIVPSPKTDWEASTWLYTSMGDVFFSANNPETAKNHYFDALNCPGGIENPYIHFSLGQAHYELEEMERAKQSFLKAYMLDGEAIFEDEDPKYFDLIKAVV